MIHPHPPTAGCVDSLSSNNDLSPIVLAEFAIGWADAALRPVVVLMAWDGFDELRIAAGGR